MLGSSNRPLKSLTDMIKGKQGRFRENLLGKRVDYSARSVIVVGPTLRLHQCGLPKKIALELFQPFIIRRLKELDHADTIKSAKKMLERKDDEVWDILEEVIRNHPVLLNRAPTLHRMGIQAFEPVLVEGNAIKLHPLVCKGFNADFDGDQMAVHLPLSIEAQVEAHTLMMATNNIFSPANGAPIISPSQDVVMGCYYMTMTLHAGQHGRGHDLLVARRSATGLFAGRGRHARPHQGPAAARSPAQDRQRSARQARRADRHHRRPRDVQRHAARRDAVLQHPDAVERVGEGDFRLLSGSGPAEDDRPAGRHEPPRLPQQHAQRPVVRHRRPDHAAQQEPRSSPTPKTTVLKIHKLYQRGIITEGERYNQVLDAWTHAREQITTEMMTELENDHRHAGYVNPIYLMAHSGARGGVEQIRQLAGMRGLMAKPSGKIIETPIKANFREGLTVLEYFSSTHGARKGLADTALKTADSGYLTRKLADVAQNVVITMHDCGTTQGITKGVIYRGEKVEVGLADSIRGRVSRANIVNPITDEVIVRENELITPTVARRIEELGLEKIQVRSPMTCDAPLGICRLCYGMDLSTGTMVEEGMAVGHHRRPEHRRAGHAVDDADVPHRRHRPARRSSKKRNPGQEGGHRAVHPA